MWHFCLFYQKRYSVTSFHCVPVNTSCSCIWQKFVAFCFPLILLVYFKKCMGLIHALSLCLVSKCQRCLLVVSLNYGAHHMKSSAVVTGYIKFIFRRLLYFHRLFILLFSMLPSFFYLTGDPLLIFDLPL